MIWNVYEPRCVVTHTGAACHVSLMDKSSEDQLQRVLTHVRQEAQQSFTNVLSRFHPIRDTSDALLASTRPLADGNTESIVGVALLDLSGARACEVLWLSVTMRGRGAGFGRTLLAEAVRYAALCGFCHVSAPRPLTTRLFARYGFRRAAPERGMEMVTYAVTAQQLKDFQRASRGALTVASTMASEEAPPGDSSSEGRREIRELENAHLRAYTRCSVPAAPALFESGDLIFREARDGDRRQWCRTALEAFRHNIGGFESLDVSLHARCRLVAALSSDDSVVGLVAMQADGWVSLIACQPAYQGQGVGAFLLFLALEWGRRRAVPSASLTPFNARSRHFYRRWGFVETNRHCRNSVSDTEPVLGRQLVRSIFLLPDGRPPTDYVRGYNPAGEVVYTLYYCYTFPGVPAGAKPSTTDDDEEEQGEATPANKVAPRARARPAVRNAPRKRQRRRRRYDSSSDTDSDSSSDSDSSTSSDGDISSSSGSSESGTIIISSGSSDDDSSGDDSTPPRRRLGEKSARLA